MSAARDSDAPHDCYADDLNPRSDTLAVLVRIALALERLGAALQVPVPHAETGPAHDLFSLDRIAEHLGVSKRWVQRHLRPTMRSGPRGKAWYRLADVEAQVACCATPAEPEARRGAPSRARGSVGRARSTTLRPSSAEVAAVEEALRAGLAKPTRRPR